VCGGEGSTHPVGIIMGRDKERRPGIATNALGGGAFRQDDKCGGVDGAWEDLLNLF